MTSEGLGKRARPLGDPSECHHRNSSDKLNYEGQGKATTGER